MASAIRRAKNAWFQDRAQEVEYGMMDGCGWKGCLARIERYPERQTRSAARETKIDKDL